jgi:PKD repeat protein
VPYEWNWSFGDGSYSDLKNPTHLYTLDGVYTIRLNVTNTLGSDATQQILFVTPTPPSANIGGGGGGGVSTNGWVDGSVVIAFVAMTIPAALIAVFIIAGRRRDDY